MSFQLWHLVLGVVLALLAGFYLAAVLFSGAAPQGESAGMIAQAHKDGYRKGYRDGSASTAKAALEAKVKR